MRTPRAHLAAIAIAIAIVVGATAASGQDAEAPISVSVPTGLTTLNFGKRLAPKITCQAAFCQVGVSARVSAADARLFGLRSRVLAKTFEDLELPRGESDTADLFGPRNEPAWSPVADGSRVLPTRSSLTLEIVATVTADGQTSTITTPVSLKWPAVKRPTGRGHTGGIVRVTVPRKVSLRARRVTVVVTIAADVRKAILQSAMIGPGGASGFLGKFEVTHGGQYRISMLVHSERRLVRQASGVVPSTAKIEILLARQDGGRPDNAARFFTLVR